MAFVDLPIETDPDVLKDEAVAYIQDRVPGWEAAAGNLETILIEAIAEMASEQAEVAAQVPSAVFREFGKRLVGLDPIEGVQAIGATTWTMTDTAGHVIPVGSQVTIDSILFETSVEGTVPAGSSSVVIPIVAVEPGEDANALTGDAEPVDTVAYLDSVVLVGTTSGGVDAETDDEYLDRLVDELALMAPRPILPEDFEVMARRIAGVDRALAVDGFNPATTTFIGDLVNGSPNVNVDTGPELNKLGVGLVIPAQTNLPATYIVGISGNTVTLAHNATATNGNQSITVNGSYGHEKMVAVAAVDEDGEAVAAGIKTQIKDFLEARREANFVVNTIDPTYTTLAVTTSVVVLPGFDEPTTVAQVQAAIQDFLQPYNFGRVSSGDGRFDRPWIKTEKVGRLNLAQVILSVEGVAFISTLTTSYSATLDVPLSGAAALTRPGTITVTAV